MGGVWRRIILLEYKVIAVIGAHTWEECFFEKVGVASPSDRALQALDREDTPHGHGQMDHDPPLAERVDLDEIFWCVAALLPPVVRIPIRTIEREALLVCPDDLVEQLRLLEKSCPELDACN